MNNILQLHSGDASVRLVPAAGGRISALRLVKPGGGVADILYPYPEDFFGPIRWAKGGIYPLMPYSNRIANASVQVNGEAVRLVPHPDGAPHTVHGNAHRLAWKLEQSDATSAVMTLDAAPGAEWPWHYTGRMRAELTPHALAVHVELRNADTRVMPAGMGLHPYFQHQPEARVGYGATAVWPSNSEFLPVSPRAPLAGEIYSPPRTLPVGGLTHYVGGWDGTALIDLPDGARLRTDADAAFGHMVVHRPDNLAYLCLEPVSHVTDAFNLAARGVANTGAHWLAPGKSMGGTIRFQLVDDV